MRDKIFVFGASGHAKVVLDIIEQQGLFQVDFLVDDDIGRKGKYVSGYQILGDKNELLLTDGAITKGIVAIGKNEIRGQISSWLYEHDFSMVAVIHPAACIGRGVEVGVGTAIMGGAVVNCDTDIGENVIINTKASVDHDCIIGNNVHIAPGSVLCGGVTVEEGTFICAGATVIPNVTIGRGAVVGAGATVVGDVPPGVMVVGTPARIIPPNTV